MNVHPAIEHTWKFKNEQLYTKTETANDQLEEKAGIYEWDGVEQSDVIHPAFLLPESVSSQAQSVFPVKPAEPES